ncbi:hypothetical protein [Poseidonocella sedimentorum]|nr:hypothetical protein [Poseidonocella sedimentorum]
MALLFVLPQAGNADAFSCRFETECFESEACAETSFELSLSTEITGDAELVTDAETVGGIASRAPETTLFFNGNNENGSHLLTISHGAARYSVQYYAGPMVITYLGACEEAA